MDVNVEKRTKKLEVPRTICGGYLEEEDRLRTDEKIWNVIEN